MPKKKHTIDAFNLSSEDMIKLINNASHVPDSDPSSPLTLEELEATGLVKSALDRLFVAADLSAGVANTVNETLIDAARIMLEYAEEKQQFYKVEDIPAEVIQSYSTSVDNIITYTDRIMEIVANSKALAASSINIMNDCIAMMKKDKDENEEEPYEQTKTSTECPAAS